MLFQTTIWLVKLLESVRKFQETKEKRIYIGVHLFGGGTNASFSPGLRLCRRAVSGALGDPSGIQQPRTIRAEDCADEHAVGDTGDEVLDVLQSGERWYCLLKGFVGRNPGKNITPALVQSLTAGEFPHFAAVSDSGVFESGARIRRCAGRGTIVYGFGHGRLPESGLVATLLIVRGETEIFCKAVSYGLMSMRI
jgi:hypothetical protein